MQRIPILSVFLLTATLGQIAPGSIAFADSPPSIGPDPASYEQAVGRAIAYLREAQAEDGSFSHHAGPGVTALATTALLRHGRTPNDPLVAKALAYLVRHRHDDGGIYQQGTHYRNYETCLAILCFSEANRNTSRYDDLLRDAERFVKEIQWEEGEGHAPSSTSYGGSGYGKHNRPDLSNTNFLIDALQAVGRGPEDLALQRALLFVSRCQNLETEHNTTPFAAKIEDGGFYYTPAAGGTSQAGQTPNGGLRSYGSMTYAGLKSMLYAGVGPEDPRVKAAATWVRQHYTVTENPGLGADGLFYYYHTFAKTLDALGENRITDVEGTSHDWRRELAEELFRTQNEDGSWLGGSRRWLEGDPQLVTTYALLALSYCRPR